jgi:hypothetical protein
MPCMTTKRLKVIVMKLGFWVLREPATCPPFKYIKARVFILNENEMTNNHTELTVAVFDRSLKITLHVY